MQIQSSPLLGQATRSTCSWTGALETHGKGFVGFGGTPSARHYALALNLPENIVRRVAQVNANLTESMLALRGKCGLMDKVFVNLLNFTNSWSTLPESIPEWAEVNAKCRVLRCDRELSLEFDPQGLKQGVL